MTQIAVIDWDQQELRTAVGEVRRGELRTAECSIFPWEEAEQQGLEAGTLPAVQALLERAGVERMRAVLLARRHDLEVLHWLAPPAADEELPLMVENFLASDLGMGTEHAAFDYWTLDDEENVSRYVAITAMENEQVDRYRKTAEKLHLRRPRLSVRACGAASFLATVEPDAKSPTLVVAPSLEELDVAMVHDGRLAYWRSAYCSPTGDSSAFHNFVSAEVSRTLTVAEDHLPPGVSIESISVCSSAKENSSVIEQLQRTLELPVNRLTAKLEGVDLSYNGDGELPGRFAPLLGALAAAAQGQRPPVDLFNPPKPQRASAVKRPHALGGALLIMLLVFAALMIRDRVTGAEEAAAQLAADLSEIEAAIEKVQAEAEVWEDLNQWNAANVVWLDELRDLSLRFPPPGTAVVLEFSASPRGAGGADIRLSGKTIDPEVVTELDTALRDQYRSILSRNLREQSLDPDDPFQWRFESSMTTQQRPADAYRQLIQAATTTPEGPAR